MLERLHHLHWDGIVETFIPIAADIFLVNKLLDFIGISKQAKDAAAQEIRKVRELDVTVIASVGKQGHDGTGTLGYVQFIGDKSKI